MFYISSNQSAFCGRHRLGRPPQKFPQDWECVVEQDF